MNAANNDELQFSSKHKLKIKIGPRVEANNHSRKWLWWAGGVLVLAVLLGVGLWLGLMRDRPAPPLSDVYAVAPEAAMGTVAAVEAPKEPVVPDLPFGMATGLAAGEESAAAAQYGSLRIVATTPDYAQEYLGKTAKRVRVDTNAWASVAALPHTLTNQPCGLLEVALEAEGFKAEPASCGVLIQEGRTSDANFALMPLPATLTVTCNVSGAELEIAGIKSQTAKPISIPALKPLELTVASPGWRTQKLKLGSMNPGKTYTMSVNLARAVGALRIEVEVPTNAQAYFAGIQKRIRIGTNVWKTVKSLPVVEEGLTCEEIAVRLEAIGFDMKSQTVVVQDGQTTSVSIAVSPRPSRIKIVSNVPEAEVFDAAGRRIGKVGEVLDLASFIPHLLTVRAKGFATGKDNFTLDKPDAEYEDRMIKLDMQHASAVRDKGLMYPAQIQTEAYINLVKADQSLDADRLDEALSQYNAAHDYYVWLIEEFPEWEPRIIQYRKRYCDTQIADVERRISTTP